MSEAMLCGHVQRLQVGEALPFAREQTSAINKSKVDAVTVTTTGLSGMSRRTRFSWRSATGDPSDANEGLWADQSGLSQGDHL